MWKSRTLTTESVPLIVRRRDRKERTGNSEGEKLERSGVQENSVLDNTTGEEQRQKDARPKRATKVTHFLTVPVTREPASTAPKNSNRAAARTACLRVKTRADTAVDHELATSLETERGKVSVSGTAQQRRATHLARSRVGDPLSGRSSVKQGTVNTHHQCRL